MTTQSTESTATEDQASQDDQATRDSESQAQKEQPKPTETVDFWKQKAREQEKRAKDNADAAGRLKKLEDAQKTEAEKSTDRIKELEQQIPQAVTTAFREAAITFGGISRDDADLFLTGTDQDTLAKQAARLVERTAEQQKADVDAEAERKKTGNRVPKEGTATSSGTTTEDDEREFARTFFGGGA